MLIFQFGKGIKYWKKNHGLFSPSRPASTALPAHPISPNRPASFPPLSCCQAGPGDSRTPRVSLTPSLVETVTQTDPFALVRPGKPIPFPLLLAAPPARKIPAPPASRCSVQATVGCLIISLACRPLSHRIVPSHFYSHRCAFVLPLLHREPPRCHGQGAGRQVLGRIAASSLLVRAWTPFRLRHSLPFHTPRQRALAHRACRGPWMHPVDTFLSNR
jgi:hypothetical protein